MGDRSADAAAIKLMLSQHGCAPVEQLRQVGLSYDQIRHRVRKGVFVRHARGLVGLAGGGDSFDARAMRYVFMAGSNAVASLWTAAQLHGLDAPRERQIHALVRGERPREPSPELYVHRTRYLPPEHVTTCRAIPTTSLDRTIVDCASPVDLWTAMQILDSSSPSAAMYRRINATARRMSNGRPGVRAVADATEPGAADRFRSMLERRAREALRMHGVPNGEWNVVIADARGPIREVDLVYRHQRLAIEFDGLRVHREPNAMQRDRATDRRMQVVGWRVLRFTWQDVVLRHTMPGEVLEALYSL